MKLTLIFTLLVFVTFGNSFSQTKLSLKLKKATMQELIETIEEQTDYVFLYKDEIFSEGQKYSVDFDEMSIDEVLQSICETAGVDFEIREDFQIVLKEKEFETVIAIAQQSRTITGVVTDNKGLPLPGVTIVVKGTTMGVVSDISGKYNLEIPENAEVLLFSFVGMQTLEVSVNGQTVINASLQEDVIGLDEVVAIGYGVQKRSDLTGSVSVVKSEDILKTPTNNAMEAIQGLVPGMTITRTSGAAGAGVNILVRGNRSINGSNSPLFIIDGVQGASFEDISATDIESINVLKDASSTAIYGSQGSNGVVIITTKKGKAGKLKISLNSYYGVNGLTKYPSSRSGEDYIQLRREAYRTSGLWNSKADDQAIFSDWEWDAIQNDEWVDWQDLILESGTLQNHTATISGGTEKTQSLLTVGYMNEGGMYKNDNMDKYTVRLNVNHNITDWAKVGLNSQLTYYDIDSRTDPLKYALYESPLGVPYDENGNINPYPIPGSTGDISPLVDEIPGTAENNTLRTNNIINSYLDLTPIKGLNFRSNFAFNLSSSRNGAYYNSVSIKRLGGSRQSSYSSNNSRFINWDNILSYEREIGDHSFKVTGLTSYISSKRDNVSASGLNQQNPAQLFYSLQSNSEDSKQTSSGYVEYTNFSVAGRLNYSYRDKYLLTVSMRADGASRLAVGNKWDSFPSVALGWRVTEEAFMKNTEVISNLKLRASYGISGNSAIPPYGTQSSMRYNPSGFSFGDQDSPYFLISQYGNATLGWEKSESINIGVDLGFFDNRLSLTADAYKTSTSDILLSRNLPWSAGGKGKSVFQNIGETENKGIELSINSVNFTKKDFKWTTALTFSTSKEQIVKLIDDSDIINGGKTTSLIIGQPINTWFNYVSDGIWQTGEEGEMAKFNENGHNFIAGDIKVKDLNGDYIIDGTEDRQAVGSMNPKWEGGLQNTFEYKNFDFSFFIYARMGQTIWGEFLGRYNPDGDLNGPAGHDYWTPENPSNDYPRPDSNKSSISKYQFSDMLMFADGSYVKLRNVTLGYSLPKAWLDRISFSNIRLYATGSNLATWANDSRLDKYDPERGGSESSPLSKQLIFGVNIDF